MGFDAQIHRFGADFRRLAPIRKPGRASVLDSQGRKAVLACVHEQAWRLLVRDLGIGGGGMQNPARV